LRAGVDRQREDCLALAERLGWTVSRIYVDNDISAYSGKRRPDYEALCDDVKNGTVNAVIAWHPDRLHRRSAELESWLDLCGDDVAHATVQAGLWDLSTPSGRMTARILGAVAQHESEHKSERVRAAKTVDARNGKFNGGSRCYGYEPDGMTVRESEAAEIRSIADAITRGVSLRSLARELNERGISTTTGSQGWSQAKLRSVLLSPRLAGLRSHGEHDGKGNVVTKLYRGQWPAILDETVYAAVRAVLEDPKRAVGPRMGRVPTSLGTGLFRCGICDQPTMRRAKGSQGQAIYRCGSTADGGRHVSRNAGVLDQYVADAVIERLSQPGYVQAMADRVAIVPNSAALVAERDQIRAALDELAAAADSGATTPALALTLARQTRELTARAEEIAHLLAQGVRRSPVANLIGVDDIRAAWEAMTLPEQRAILAAVVTVTLRPGKRGPGFDTKSVKLDFAA
jgi:DNA invertase Pin-like site-specific DNA recombinase